MDGCGRAKDSPLSRPPEGPRWPADRGSGPPEMGEEESEFISVPSQRDHPSEGVGQSRMAPRQSLRPVGHLPGHLRLLPDDTVSAEGGHLQQVGYQPASLVKKIL